MRDPDELDEDVLDELDLDGDGVGAADPDYGRPVVEKVEEPEEVEKARETKAPETKTVE